jgi:phosphate starvation-inducible PhoH-like protein
MSETSLSVNSPDELLLLFGARDQNLRTIKRIFNVEITYRRGQICVSGAPQAVEKASSIFNKLLLLSRLKGKLTAVDVRDAISLEDKINSQVESDLRGRALSIDISHVGRKVHPKTSGQLNFIEMVRASDLSIAVGPAGTGKTFLAVATAIEALKSKLVRRIVLVRPAVEAGESLGYLPGDLKAKINPYLRPLLDALTDLLDFEQSRTLIEQELIEVAPLAYMRGRTLNDAFIILDEAQNATIAQMKMFLTRMGQRSKMVICGDTTQVDLPAGIKNGLSDAIQRLGGISGVSIIRLTKSDTVRHRLVQSIIEAYEYKDI